MHTNQFSSLLYGHSGEQWHNIQSSLLCDSEMQSQWNMLPLWGGMFDHWGDVVDTCGPWYKGTVGYMGQGATSSLLCTIVTLVAALSFLLSHFRSSAIPVCHAPVSMATIIKYMRLCNRCKYGHGRRWGILNVFLSFMLTLWWLKWTLDE